MCWGTNNGMLFLPNFVCKNVSRIVNYFYITKDFGFPSLNSFSLILNLKMQLKAFQALGINRSTILTYHALKLCYPFSC